MRAAGWLAACGLPRAWHARRAFTVLDTRLADDRLAALRGAWRADAGRCERLWLAGFRRTGGPAPQVAGDDRVDDACPPAAHDVQRIELEDGRLIVTTHPGEPTESSRALRYRVDAFVLDTADARSDAPHLLLRRLGRLAAPDARLVAMAATTVLHEALGEAGFRIDGVEREPGLEPMTIATHAPRWTVRRRWVADAGRPEALGSARAPRHAAVVGAGLAGTAVAAALARSGWTVEVYERAPAAATRASGNPAGAFHPHVSADDCTLSRLTRAGLSALHRELGRLGARDAGVADACGTLQLASDGSEERALDVAIDRLGVPAIARGVDRAEASGRAGLRLVQGGAWFPGGGWARPPELCALRLRAVRGSVRLVVDADVAGLESTASGWRLLGRDASMLGQATIVVLANAEDAARLLAGVRAVAPPLQTVRGQLTFVPHDGPGPDCVLTGGGYLLPSIGGRMVAGVDYGGESPQPTVDGHRRNLARLRALLDPAEPLCGRVDRIDPARAQGRAAFRCTTADRLPAVGAALRSPDRTVGPDGRATAPPWARPRLTGLYLLTGLGSRGLVWSSLAAEHLVAQIEDSPSPLPASLADAIDPARL